MGTGELGAGAGLQWAGLQWAGPAVNNQRLYLTIFSFFLSFQPFSGVESFSQFHFLQRNFENFENFEPLILLLLFFFSRKCRVTSGISNILPPKIKRIKKIDA